MSKTAVVAVSLAVLLFGGALVDHGALAAAPIDPEEPVFLNIPELAGITGLRYAELRVEFFTERHQPIKPPPGVQPIDPLNANAPADSAVGTTHRGLPSFLGAHGGGPGFGLGGSSAAPSSDRSAEPALTALRDLNRALGY